MTGAADRQRVQRTYTDARGVEREVPGETLRWLDERLGPEDDGSSPIVLRLGERPTVDVEPGQVRLEGGSIVEVSGGPVELPLGYHRHLGEDGAERALVICPSRCHLDPTRAWGWAAQLYATRSRSSWGIGDLRDLADLGRWSAGRGAGFVLVNPIGAVAPSGPQQPSPYFPGTRRFRSPLYLAVDAVLGSGAAAAASAVERAAVAGRALNAERIIDRDEIWSLKRTALESIWQATERDERFEGWHRRQGPSLHRFAAWSAAADRHGPDWRRWPSEVDRAVRSWKTAAGDESRDGAEGFIDPERVRFHAWLQWLLEEQMGAAAGEISIIQDLPIGVDPGGFDAWEWQDLLALDASVGAPPDEFNQAGQDWGLPPFLPDRLRAADYEPFIASIRASMAAGGGLRIDHVMGLFRLWWIPEDMGAKEGAYVRYPADDLLALVALESQRAKATVVGEDLGTVEERAREALADHDVLSYRLLWFEEEGPPTWPAKALAAITTHDLPTVVGLWSGSDLAEQHRLGLEPNDEGTAEMVASLADGTGLPADADGPSAVVAAHRLLATSPSRLVAATLDDALGLADRPNVPGADGDRPNWSLALPKLLEDVVEDPLVGEVATVLDRGVRDTST